MPAADVCLDPLKQLRTISPKSASHARALAMTPPPPPSLCKPSAYDKAFDEFCKKYLNSTNGFLTTTTTTTTTHAVTTQPFSSSSASSSSSTHTSPSNSSSPNNSISTAISPKGATLLKDSQNSLINKKVHVQTPAIETKSKRKIIHIQNKQEYLMKLQSAQRAAANAAAATVANSNVISANFSSKKVINLNNTIIENNKTLLTLNKRIDTSSTNRNSTFVEYFNKYEEFNRQTNTPVMNNLVKHEELAKKFHTMRLNFKDVYKSNMPKEAIAQRLLDLKRKGNAMSQQNLRNINASQNLSQQVSANKRSTQSNDEASTDFEKLKNQIQNILSKTNYNATNNVKEKSAKGKVIVPKSPPPPPPPTSLVEKKSTNTTSTNAFSYNKTIKRLSFIYEEKKDSAYVLVSPSFAQNIGDKTNENVIDTTTKRQPIAIENLCKPIEKNSNEDSIQISINAKTVNTSELAVKPYVVAKETTNADERIQQMRNITRPTTPPHIIQSIIKPIKSNDADEKMLITAEICSYVKNNMADYTQEKSSNTVATSSNFTTNMTDATNREKILNKDEMLMKQRTLYEKYLNSKVNKENEKQLVNSLDVAVTTNANKTSTTNKSSNEKLNKLESQSEKENIRIEIVSKKLQEEPIYQTHTQNNQIVAVNTKPKASNKLGFRVFACGMCKMGHLPIPKENYFIERGNFGDDAGFCAENLFGDAIGIADGATGNCIYGYDPGDFSRNLMKSCSNFFTEENNIIDAKSLLMRAYDAVQEKTCYGSCTACVVTLDSESGTLTAANVGDSGYLIIRDGKIVRRSEPQRINFECPRQLDSYPWKERSRRMGISYTKILANETECETFETMKDDLVIISSDGLFDNLDYSEIEEVFLKSKTILDAVETLVFRSVKYYRKPDDILVICGKVVENKQNTVAQQRFTHCI